GIEREWRQRGAGFERIDSGAGPRLLRAWRFARGAAERVTRLKRHGALDVALDMGAGAGCDVVQPHSGAPRDVLQGSVDSCPTALSRALRTALGRASPVERARARLRAVRFETTPPPQVIAVSRRVARGLAEAYHLPADHVRLIPNGVDL